jgi:hypothetical protein
LIVVSEVEIVFDERIADQGVVADTIAAHPRIEERERENENQAQEKLRLPRAMRERCAGDVPKSCKQTDRASFRLPSI